MGRSQRLAVWFGPSMNEFCLRIFNLFVFQGNRDRVSLHVPGKQPAGKVIKVFLCSKSRDLGQEEKSYRENKGQRKHIVTFNIFGALLFNILRALY